MTDVARRLTECDTMLNTIARRYALARRRLTEVEPGYPPNTPGAGEPGGGTGYTAGSSTERLVVPASNKTRGLTTQAHAVLDKARYIDTAPYTIADITARITHLGALRPTPTNSPRHRLQLLVWSRWAIRQLVNDPDADPPTRHLENLHGTINHLHRVVTTWGTPPTRPKPRPATNQLADDPTELWCRNCLNIGAREPRWRGYLDRWCYDFLKEQGFLPPADLLRIRQTKRNTRPGVTQRDVEPFIRAWREQNKKRRKKTG